MSEPIRDLETAVRELGALPMLAGIPALTDEQRATVAEQLANSKPATAGLVLDLARSVQNVREHEHPTWEDLYCLNLLSFMGERMGSVLRRLLDAETRIAELEASQGTVFRASHDAIVMGLYSTAAEARKHCETEMRREYDETTKVSLWWKEDEDTVDQPEDGEQELYVHATPVGMSPGRTWNSGYVVTPLEVASEFDPEAEE